jgi:hypothetical protein
MASISCPQKIKMIKLFQFNVPFVLLSLASLICMLVVMLAGMTSQSPYMFQVKTQSLSIPSSLLQGIGDSIMSKSNHLSELTGHTNSASAITAASLGLADSYRIFLWNFCAITGDKTTCSQTKANWAASELNFISAASDKLALPKEVRYSLKIFTALSECTAIFYIFAFITVFVELVLEIIFSILHIRHRGCCGLRAIFSVLVTAAASAMGTAQSSTAVGAIKLVTKAYGAEASFNPAFLLIAWLAFAFYTCGVLLRWLC